MKPKLKMEKNIKNRRAVSGCPLGAALYAGSREHLQDELRRLDLLVRMEVLKQRESGPQNPWEQFKGLVLSEEEIARLLAEDAGPLILDRAPGARSEPSTGRVPRPGAAPGGAPGSDSPAGTGAAEIEGLARALNKLQSRIQERCAASLEAGTYLTLPHLSRLFDLSPPEEQCLIVCLAPELDRKYEKLYAYLQDDVTCKKPSVDLALKLLFVGAGDRLEGRCFFDEQSPLLKYRLLRLAPDSPNQQAPLLSRSIKLDDRIVNFLLEFPQMNAGLGRAARLIAPQPGREAAVSPGLSRRIYEFVRFHIDEAGPGIDPLFYFRGPYGSGQLELAESICGRLGISLIVADAAKMLAGETSFQDMAWLLGREAALRPAALCLENFDSLLGDGEKLAGWTGVLLEGLEAFPCLTFLVGTSPWRPRGALRRHVFIEVEFPVPGERERKDLWERLRAGYQFAGDVDLGELTSKFRFTPGQIRDALDAAQNLARWRSPGGGEIIRQDLHDACRLQAHHRLGGMARKIEPRYSWREIVLPPDARNQLGEICSQVKHRHIVYGEWGFDKKHPVGGLNALFHGPPGTGKTMAAEIIAGDVSLDLYKIDLSQVVSKYIGETEKNLNQIFQEAQASQAILFFDEADALFGKRSEVRDAHDRYANVEIAYLLQKMDEYDGIVILATNFRQNMDDAFVRRLHFVVEFPFPDDGYRERIWAGVWPENTPRDGDLDLAWLARSFRITGGNIRNIAVTAAFLAAEESRPVAMRHMVRAARRELQKMGKLCTRDDLGEYYDMLD
jgi:hypothetical protein